MAEFRRHAIRNVHHKSTGFWRIYFLSVIFTFHALLVAYINSTFMENYLSPEGVGALFAIGSSLAVFAFLFISYALRRVGNIKLTVGLALLDIAALVTLGITDSQATAIVAFITFITVSPLIFLNIDIFAEYIIGNNEESTGSKRGLALTLKSLAAMLAPLAMGLIVDGSDNLQPVYLTAAGVFSIFVVFVLLKFPKFQDPHYEHLKISDSLYQLWHTSDMRNVLLSHLTLQMFFAFAVIYIPLYLSTEIGLAWDTISYIISAGLLAYVLLEWPIGVVADKFLGEKELMAFGFLILAVSTAYIAFMTSAATILAWMVLVFMTRVGAALVETTTESYFFKHTDGDDAEVIGFFRLLRPLSMVLGALLGSAALLYMPFNLIFVVLALLMVPGLFFTMALKDTK